MGELGNVTFACAEPVRLAEFWAAALGYVPVEVPAEVQREVDAAVERGELDPTAWAMLAHPEGVGPRLLFQRRPKTPTEHIPIHLDVSAADREAEVERLVSLGADGGGDEDADDRVVRRDVHGHARPGGQRLLRPVSLEELVAGAEADENVIGLVVFGSRGRGAFVTERSDWDVFVVVCEARGDRPFRHGAAVETVELTLDDLRSQPAWNRYALAWLEPQVDKTGEVAAALRDAVRVDPATAAEPLDGYVNLLHRSLKNDRLGLGLASLLDAQESIPRLLEFLFAVHGRLRPYNKWLAWELEHHPLPEPRCESQLGAEALLPRLERIARAGEPAEQRALFREVEALARERGHGGTIDSWEPDVAWLRGD